MIKYFSNILKQVNTLLEKLFEKYNLSEKDKYEIRQIYDLLPPDKKQNLLNNFETLALKLRKIEEEISSEREILIWDALLDIKNVIDRVKKERLKNETKSKINFLKQGV